MRSNTPEISVIIPALNEEKYIKLPLESLRRQSFKDFETIVVDGGSGDRTRAIARKYAKVVIERRQNIGRGRNTGAANARGRILVFLDADTEPSPDLLKAYAKGLDGAVAATGPILPLETASMRLRLGFKLVSTLLVRLSILIGRPSIVGSNFAVKRSAFKKVGGFDNNLATYEDWELSNRLKKVGRIVYVPDARAYTSTRRIIAWGIPYFFMFHFGNMVRYHVLGNPKEKYAQIR